MMAAVNATSPTGLALDAGHIEHWASAAFGT